MIKVIYHSPTLKIMLKYALNYSYTGLLELLEKFQNKYPIVFIWLSW